MIEFFFFFCDSGVKEKQNLRQLMSECFVWGSQTLAVIILIIIIKFVIPLFVVEIVFIYSLNRLSVTYTS